MLNRCSRFTLIPTVLIAHTYIAVRQCFVHDVLCVELQGAGDLARPGMFDFHSKFSDEAVNAHGEIPRQQSRHVTLRLR